MDTLIRSLIVIKLISTARAFTKVCDTGNLCGVGGVCSTYANSPGYTCHCYAGFIQKNPQTCVDRDECSMATGLCHNGTCVNTPGSFRCNCSNGFKGNHCLQKTHACDSSPCLNGAKCTPSTSTSGYTCACYAGYTPPNCEDRDECSMRHGLCHSGTCLNTPGSFKCQCNEGYSGSHCTKRNQCASSPCVNGKCIPSPSGSGYTCECYAGFVPPHCEDRNECQMARNLCHNGTCVNTPGSFRCNCNAGFAGSHCTKATTPTNPCDSSPCQADSSCVQTATGYNCTCPDGFMLPYCNDKNECNLVSNLCHHGICINTMGSYTCKCFRGFSGFHCDVPLPSSSSPGPSTSLSSSSQTVTSLPTSSQAVTSLPTSSQTVTSLPTSSQTVTSLSSSSQTVTVTSLPTSSQTVTSLPTSSQTVTSLSSSSQTVTVTSLPTSSQTVTSLPTSSQTVTSLSTSSLSSSAFSTSQSTTVSPSSRPTKGTGQHINFMSSNVKPRQKGWTNGHWYVFVIVGVVICAATATGVIIIVRRRAKDVGVYNKFNNNPPSTPTSPTPLQQNNPLYDAIHNHEMSNPDPPGAPVSRRQDHVLYMTSNENGNNVSEI